MQKNCLTCEESFYVSPSREHIKNCSYECNKVWRKQNMKQPQDCLCGCGDKVKSIRSKYIFGHSPQPKVRSGLFKKGHKQVFFRHSDESKVKMSKAQLGRESTYKGERHWNWKGGVDSGERKERVRFHKYFRPKVLQRDNYTCQICDAYGAELQVDHIKKWSEYPELRFELSNCRTVCKSCHYYLTYKRKMPKGIAWGKNLSRRIG